MIMEIKGWKSEKMKNLEDFTVLAVLKGDIQVLQHYSILFALIYYYIGGIWGRISNVVQPRGKDQGPRTKGERNHWSL